MIEKDFWVCWSLALLFGADPSSDLVEGLVFKGGTSLSKVFGIIHRFSEDIDLTIPRAAIGIRGDDDLVDSMSVTTAKRRLEAMERRGTEWVAETALAEMTTRIHAALHGSADDVRWTLQSTEAMVLTFRYPAALEAAEYGIGAYVAPAVRLEFGIRNEPWPSSDGTVAPYVDDVAPVDARLGPMRVRVLDPMRTLWEKATILHLEAHRPTRVADPDRLARHYVDLAAMVSGPLGDAALERLELLRHVAEYKAAYFRTPWARYDHAARGEIRLVPDDALRERLRRDHDRMREMYFQAPPGFDEILEVLRAFEERVRAAARVIR